jgi:DNA-directed RNA polymerase subunit N (RpoN/RPB10)
MSNYIYGSVVCTSCGFPIGGYIMTLFFEKRASLYNPKGDKEIDLSELNMHGNEGIETGEILDELKVFNICCRMHLITTVQQPR